MAHLVKRATSGLVQAARSWHHRTSEHVFTGSLKEAEMDPASGAPEHRPIIWVSGTGKNSSERIGSVLIQQGCDVLYADLLLAMTSEHATRGWSTSWMAVCDACVITEESNQWWVKDDATTAALAGLPVFVLPQDQGKLDDLIASPPLTWRELLSEVVQASTEVIGTGRFNESLRAARTRLGLPSGQR